MEKLERLVVTHIDSYCVCCITQEGREISLPNADLPKSLFDKLQLAVEGGLQIEDGTSASPIVIHAFVHKDADGKYTGISGPIIVSIENI